MGLVVGLLFGMFRKASSNCVSNGFAIKSIKVGYKPTFIKVEDFANPY